MNDITIIEEIVGVFNIFHDGVIVKHEIGKGILKLKIDIPYLATRIQKQFSDFDIEIIDCENIMFKPWHDENNTSSLINDTEKIFENELEILTCESDKNRILIHCSQPNAGTTSHGGILSFDTVSIKVTDESGKVCDYKKLEKLCDDYWTEWENKHKKSPGA